MKFTALGLDSSTNSSRIAPPSQPCERAIPRAVSRPLGRGRDYRYETASIPVPRAVTWRVPPPELAEIQLEMPAPALATTRGVTPPEPQEIKLEVPPLAHATTRRVLPPEPEELNAEMPPRGLLGSLFSFLRGGAPARKQLRLVETVPLGEKRFVAIIHAQGRKYLVGGGTSGVALLTSLDEPASHSDIAPVAQPAGVAG
jgi:Flagellar biosynthesis protein, FliO